MILTKIKSKSTYINHRTGRNVPDCVLQGAYEVIAQDEKYIYIRRCNNFFDVPYVDKYSKKDFSFWNQLKEISFEE